jgi:hypothetical protein
LLDGKGVGVSSSGVVEEDGGEEEVDEVRSAQVALV